MSHYIIQKSIYNYLISQNLLQTAKRLKKECQLSGEDVNGMFCDTYDILSIKKDESKIDETETQTTSVNGLVSENTEKKPIKRKERKAANKRSRDEGIMCDGTNGHANGAAIDSCTENAASANGVNEVHCNGVAATESLQSEVEISVGASKKKKKKTGKKAEQEDASMAIDEGTTKIVKPSNADKESVPATAFGSDKKSGNAPFRKISDDYAHNLKNVHLKNNSFWNKKSDSFATKAAIELGRVKGKNFRHEKSKKKKASWRGVGDIPMGVNSIMFDSD